MIAFLKKYGLQYHLSQGLIAFALCLTLYFNLLHPNIEKDVARMKTYLVYKDYKVTAEVSQKIKDKHEKIVRHIRKETNVIREHEKKGE